MPLGTIIRKVFISSTVYDLEKERRYVRGIFERYRGPATVRFRCMVSDHADFPVSPGERASKHSYPICLDRVAACEYFVLLVRNRYGRPNVAARGGLISITHAEYREAVRLRLPRFVFVDQRTWDAKNKATKSRPQRFVPSSHSRIFDFVDELRREHGNWITFFNSKLDIGAAIRAGLLSWDDSTFVGDLSIPDGAPVRGGVRFQKIWEIKNTGMVMWKNRFLREENAGASGLVPDQAMIPIPPTPPGHSVRLAVYFTAPLLPATCESYWKMVDSTGAYSFEAKVGLHCVVKVL